MNRRSILKHLGATVPGLMASPWLMTEALAARPLARPVAPGPFQPTWASLQQYQVPTWYQDAKLGLWAHWGPQCQPEAGDWYARGMYQEGSDQYHYHVKKYGHPSKFGFKDVIHRWKAEQWDPEALVALYKQSGARYFFAMANHHDNLDLYNSRHQPHWNATQVGPKKDIIGGWAKAARRQGLPFGVSVHAAHAWSWYEPSQRADKTGPYAGVPYDGNLTKADGKGQWWEGLDPQELYAQRHPLSQNSEDNRMIHAQWNWGNGVTPPSQAYLDKFYRRTLDLIDQYEPDLIYFDDTALPFWPISDVGLRLAAHLYNKSMQKNGSVQAVINGKILDEQQRQCMVWDIERGQSNQIEPYFWQTDTCLGNWHYDRALYDRDGYKSAKTVIHTLIDVVSKNGNLLLNIPVRGDGSIDEKARKVVEALGVWMQANHEAIYATRPWNLFGEGPALEDAAPLSAQGFNEGKGKPFTHEDIRFTTKGEALYALVLGWPDNGRVLIKSLASQGPQGRQPVNQVTWVGTGEKLAMHRDEQGLAVTLPSHDHITKDAFALKIV